MGLQMRTNNQITQTYCKYNAHTEPIFKTLKLLNINYILKLKELKFYHKYENILLPYYLQHLPFQLNTNSHAARSERKNVQWRPMHQ